MRILTHSGLFTLGAMACASLLSACEASGPAGTGAAVTSTPAEVRGSAATTAESLSSTVRERGACQLPTLAEVIVTGSVNTTKVDDKHIAEAMLMVVDEAGNPVPDIELTGVFTGDLSGPATLTTGPDGQAHTSATGGGQHLVVGFTVDSAARVAADGSRSPVTATTEIIYPSPCCAGRTPPSQ